MIRNVVIAGFSSFVGSSLVKEIKKYRYKIIGTSRRNKSGLIKLYKSVENIKNKKSTALFFLSSNLVSNFVNQTNYSQSALKEFKNINFKNYKKVIFISSSLVYGNNKKGLRKEKYIRP